MREVEVLINTPHDAQGESGSLLTFTDNEFETVIVSLKCHGGQFELELMDNTDDFQTSLFSYKLGDNMILLEIIPEGLREFLENVELEGESAILRPGTLKW